MSDRQKTYAYAAALIAAVVILWLLFFKRDIVMASESDSTGLPLNYFNGVPNMTATGIPLSMPQSHATSPNITINSAPGSVLQTGGGGCGCGCSGCDEGSSSLTTFSNLLSSIQPQQSISWIENLDPYVAPTIKATVARAPQNIYAPLRWAGIGNVGFNMNAVN